MKQKFYRTVIKIEVLSDEEVSFADLDGVIAASDDDCSVSWEEESQEEVSEEEMRELLTNQGSDPEFFDLEEDA